ncbi:nucleotide exchange factor GrpE [Actinomycetota bacterium]|nr:nucleotide exchange factor GrpE [Micrococcales bacterium]
MTDLPREGEEVAPEQSGATDEPDQTTEAINDDPVTDADATVPGQSETDGLGQPDATEAAVSPDAALAAERLADLQRLQAEYVNYKRRVDRDRALERDHGVHAVIEALLPVLDDIHAAREHGDLTDGPFAAIADKLEKALGGFGLERYGAAGEAFDPNHHEALMHAAWDSSNPALPADAESTTVVQVLQPGYRTTSRALRPARVAVADPE